MSCLATKVLPKPFLDQLERILNAHNGYNIKESASGKTVLVKASVETQKKRRLGLRLAFAQIWQLGFHLRDPNNLAERHVEAVVKYWGEKGIAACSLQTNIAMLNVFSRWIGKPGIVKDHRHYFPEGQASRTGITQSDKSWEALAIDARKKIAEASRMDERFGCMLSLQLEFGLRMKESVEIRPGKDLVDGGRSIELYEGTKGGRVRRIEIETAEQMAAFNHARVLGLTGRSGRLRWPDCTWKQARNRFYHLMRRMGLTRAGLGVTAHGLRHQFSHHKYEKKSGGFPSPIKGGALGKIDRATHEQACLSVTRELGHGRVDVMPSYCGSYGHALRGTPSTADYILKFNVPKGGVHHGYALGI